MAKAYVDSASALMSPTAIESLIINGLRDLRLGNISAAKHDYEEVGASTQVKWSAIRHCSEAR